MPFIDRPIERPEELFDRENEFEAIRKFISMGTSMIVVGARRIGKTSLVKAATHGLPRIYIDARRFEGFKYLRYSDLLTEFRYAFNSLRSLYKDFVEVLKKVRGVRIGPLEIEFEEGRNRPLLSSMLDAIDEWSSRRGCRTIVVFDEAQELIKLKGFDILPIIAYAYDNLRNIVFIFTGSKIGLLYRFLRIDDPESPLYGRYMGRIELKPLPREKAIEFLMSGFNEYGLRVSENIVESAVDMLGGIIGWLSYLGLKAVERGVLNEDIIKEVLNDASRIVLNEFCRFVEVMGSERYVYILRAVAAEGATWSEIKNFLEIRLGTKIYDSELSRLLRNLIDNGFLEKEDNVYRAVDPILRYVARNAKC
ncbi:ATPase [Ignisphaera aggregans DSM 17230]|uniref:ATPase n=1 Tax=Ignisphaera aggregans (strain DSM 17230 / JCM 13409 / AQ1.S1) TaxID=583356 RepID=E0SSM9_IGNAA|nr:ATPase [Ignisphaera aggregans DSM 17230]